MKKKYPLKNIWFLVGMFTAIAVFWYLFGYIMADIPRPEQTPEIKRTAAIIYVSDMGAAQRFYSNLPGFRYRDGKIFTGGSEFIADTSSGSKGVFFLYLPNERTYRRLAEEAGVNVIKDEEGFYFEDPDGNRFYIKPDQG